MVVDTNISSIRQRLKGAPAKLALICFLQLGMMLLGGLYGVSNRSCDLVQSSDNEPTRIDCQNCSSNTSMDWRYIVLLIVGVLVICVGIVAAWQRSKKLCQIYGFIMMIYGFLVGLTCILTAVEIPVLKSAAGRVDEQKDPGCKSTADAMVDAAIYHCLLYGVNCGLDCFGAWYAIQSKQFFDYEDITVRLENDEHRVDSNL